MAGRQPEGAVCLSCTHTVLTFNYFYGEVFILSNSFWDYLHSQINNLQTLMIQTASLSLVYMVLANEPTFSALYPLSETHVTHGLHDE